MYIIGSMLNSKIEDLVFEEAKPWCVSIVSAISMLIKTFSLIIEIFPPPTNEIRIIVLHSNISPYPQMNRFEDCQLMSYKLVILFTSKSLNQQYQ